MIREEDVPTCPGCSKADRVERIRLKDSDPADLANWFCSRCKGRLSALPALPATGGTVPVRIGERTFDVALPQPTGARPKRRKPKEGGGDG